MTNLPIISTRGLNKVYGIGLSWGWTYWTQMLGVVNSSGVWAFRLVHVHAVLHSGRTDDTHFRYRDG